jgi:hypothetical protein
MQHCHRCWERLGKPTFAYCHDAHAQRYSNLHVEEDENRDLAVSRVIRYGYDYGCYAVHPFDQKFGAGSSGVHMGATRSCK